MAKKFILAISYRNQVTYYLKTKVVHPILQTLLCNSIPLQSPVFSNNLEFTEMQKCFDQCTINPVWGNPILRFSEYIGFPQKGLAWTPLV